ncbi:MAG: PilW family protein [Thermoanaerobaculia bacterium]
MRGYRNHHGVGRSPRSGGFSLVELLVGLAVTSMLLLAIVGVFSAGSKVARVETQNSDLQQTLRASHRQITRYVNMAGRGGLALALPNTPVYQGPALTMRNAAGVGADNGQIAIGFANTPVAVDGSDILVARGVFTTQVFQIETLAPGDFQLFNLGIPTTDPTAATDGVVVIHDLTNTGVQQDLTPLSDAITGNIPEALVLQSPMDERIVAVVELDFANSAVAAGQATLAFKVQGMTHPEYRDLYASGAGPQPVLPIGLNSVANVGVLEEYRFYVREPPPPIPGLPEGTPKLSMARMFPGTEIPYLSVLANAAVDLADNVLDMQVGLAFDSNLGPAATDQNGDGVVNEDDLEVYEAADGENDDYLFNTKEDDPAVAPWNGAAAPQPELYYVRLSLLARAGRRERNYQAPELLGYEDVQALRILNWNSFEERMFKRRFQQTVIELRNL